MQNAQCIIWGANALPFGEGAGANAEAGEGLAPPMGELAEIFDFGLRGKHSSGTAYAVPPSPEGKALSLLIRMDTIIIARFPQK